jgi:crotonobetainyl-CoA:carnitine CoA-transferase CaiB-like acyl-CoA transferase
VTLPLTGVKILDFSEHGFVPSAAAVLADWGADVVKLERPDGDAMRTIIGKGMVATVGGLDYLFEMVNRNKRGVAIDVLSPAGRQVFDRLVAWADVYITNQLPRVRRKLRTEPPDLFEVNRSLVYAKGSGQGQRGPDAEAGGFDAVSYWARGGVGQVLTAPTADRPTMQRPAFGDVPTGMYLAGGICAALLHVRQTGAGIVVDASLLGGAMWTLAPDMAYASLSGEQLPMPLDVVRPPLIQTYKTRDERFITLMMIDEGRYWAQACRALGAPDLIDSHSDADTRSAAWESLTKRVAGIIAGLDLYELESRLRAQDCIYSAFRSPPEVLHDPAVVANGYAMEHPTHAPLRLSAAPAQFDDEFPSIRRPGPRLGEHSREVLSELGFTEEQIDALASTGAIVDGAKTGD